MGIDSLDRRAAMGRGVAQKIDHRLLRGFGRMHPVLELALLSAQPIAGLIHINTLLCRMRS